MKTSSSPLRRIALLVCAGCLCAGGLTGCNSMHRRMVINSDPPGALCMLEGKEVGYTPVAVDFTYYGTREICLVKDGYKTLTVLQKVKTPWYQTMPLDFVTDNFSPVTIKNNQEFNYRMEPQVIPSNEELLERANGLRSESQIDSKP